MAVNPALNPSPSDKPLSENIMDRRIFLGSAVASAVGATLTACGGGGSVTALDPAASMERSRTTTTTVVNPPASPKSRVIVIGGGMGGNLGGGTGAITTFCVFGCDFLFSNKTIIKCGRGSVAV